MDLYALETLHREVAECDAMHHYYHYLASWQHLRYARHLQSKGNAEGARRQFKAALFQDHLNIPAQKALGGEESDGIYDTHLTSHAAETLQAYEASLGWEPNLAEGYLERGDYAEALRLFGARHEAYHRHASGLHLMRGKAFMQTGEADLAINDFTKALDLDRHNREAICLRAELYAQRGSRQLAEADQLRLARLAAL